VNVKVKEGKREGQKEQKEQKEKKEGKRGKEKDQFLPRSFNILSSSSFLMIWCTAAVNWI